MLLQLLLFAAAAVAAAGAAHSWRSLLTGQRYGIGASLSKWRSEASKLLLACWNALPGFAALRVQ